MTICTSDSEADTETDASTGENVIIAEEYLSSDEHIEATGVDTNSHPLFQQELLGTTDQPNLCSNQKIETTVFKCSSASSITELLKT